MMDEDAIYDPPEYHRIVERPEIDALKENYDPSNILIRAFVGEWRGNQTDNLEMAVNEIRSTYEASGLI